MQGSHDVPREPPQIPEGMMEEIESKIEEGEAPFWKYLGKEMALE